MMPSTVVSSLVGLKVLVVLVQIRPSLPVLYRLVST